MELSLQGPTVIDEEGGFVIDSDEYYLYAYTEQEERRNYSTQLPADKPKLTLKQAEQQQSGRPRNRPTRHTSVDLEAPVFHFGKNFQCGNLQSANFTDEGVYRLRISNDCNSRRQSQWFYFSVRGIRRATFVIGGFVKSDSLYNYGMKVCVQENGQWMRAGENISYEQDEECGGYCLRFSYKFRNPSSKTYFAYCFPYTYCDLQNFLQEIQRRKYSYCLVESLGKTLLKNDLQCITIAEGKCTPDRQLIIITGRVHPGETVASFIMQGFLNRLVGDSPQAQLLRQRYIFKVVPMLNPDGVVLGNYRLSYSGSDLNRKWKDTSAKLHPEVHTLKRVIQKLSKERTIRLMIDMHGHSRKKGVFFYGCQDRSHNTRQFPYIMSQLCPSYHYPSCCFAMPKSKEGTLRLAMNSYLKLPYIYTLESSFCGDEGTNNNYTPTDLQKIGGTLVEGMLVYLSAEIYAKESCPLIAKEVARKNELVEQLTSSKELMEIGTEDDSGSESAPSEGCYRQEEILKLIKLDPFLPPGNNSNSRREKISDPDALYRPSTTQKKPLQKVLEDGISPGCKVRVINGELFDRLNRSKTLKGTEQANTIIRADQRPIRKQHPTVVIVQDGRDVRLTSLDASRKELNKSAQYKRVKKYALEQFLQRNSRKQSLNPSDQLKLDDGRKQLPLEVAVITKGRFGARQYKAPAASVEQEPRLLRINEAKLHTNIFTPTFIAKKSATINYDCERRNSSLSGFNRSIRARDYFEEKRSSQNKRQSNFNRKSRLKDEFDFT